MLTVPIEAGSQVVNTSLKSGTYVRSRLTPPGIIHPPPGKTSAFCASVTRASSTSSSPNPAPAPAPRTT